MNEAQRKVLLDRMVEKGKREKAVIIEFPRSSNEIKILDAVDFSMYAFYGVAASGMLLAFLLAIRQTGESGGGITLTAAPEPVPHDLWSFLGSRSGRAVINGAFKTIQVIAGK